jgi:outer membrane biosynthesis protein TonB
MRNLALVWVLAACLLGCGGSRDVKDKAASAADTAAVIPDTVAVAPDRESYSTGYLIDELFNGLPDENHSISWNCHRSELRYPFYIDTAKLKLTGNRSKESVGRVIDKDIVSLRYVYNKRLRDMPGLSCTITVKFAIDRFGKVISAQMVESTANDTTLENGILRTIQEQHRPSPIDGSIHWYFGEINKPDDTTVVTCPFTFEP